MTDTNTLRNLAPLNEQMDEIKRGIVDLISEEELAKKIEKAIAAKKPLIIKFGADPSTSDLHIGHGVVLRKLRAFQDLGHQAVLIIGDFTAMIGDPTGRSKTRPMLTIEETKKNALSYVEQVGKLVDLPTLGIRYNSEWLGTMNFADVIRLAGTYTVSQMLEREDFHKRWDEEQPISLHEMLYPLAQGYDSVAIRSDVELGGTDQKFNLLVGRELQRHFQITPQSVITTPLIEGTDGERKMSKSYGNSINFTDSPDDMFGKTMSIPDPLIHKYFVYTTNAKDLDAIKASLESGKENPRDLKVRLAKEIIAGFYDTEKADEAYERFKTMFVKKEVPDDIPEFSLGSNSAIGLVDLMAEHSLAPSRSEARRLIEAGAVTLSGEKVSDPKALLTPTVDGVVLKVGKRKFLKVKI
ncbi:MAG: tyrosine--tRNA ligase [Candidatus Kapaibacterium sp.]